MRIAVAVVVGVVLLSSGHTARAAEPPRQRNETCIDSCNFAFEKCLTREGAKPTGRCDVNVVRCKNECPYEVVEVPTVPTAKSHQRCVDACRATYKKCENLADSNRQGGRCAADDMRCEKACPKPEPEVAAEPPPAPPVEAGGMPVAAPAAPAAPAVPVPEVKSQPRRAARVEGAAAPAPAVGERAGATAPTVRSEGSTPPAAAPAEASAAAAHPAQSERGFFGKLGCFFHSCEAPGSTPCLKECGIVYDVCRTRESKRGGECNTRLMHCRQDCRDAAPTAP
jgi:pyruvate/2-oxoglutarate dehydrogenase complex dihydrolipoamide acyltransferase (E2) component